MKKIIALVLVAVMLTMTLASCGGISGKYSAELLGTGVELEFKGSKVNARFKVLRYARRKQQERYYQTHRKNTLNSFQGSLGL